MIVLATVSTDEMRYMAENAGTPMNTRKPAESIEVESTDIVVAPSEAEVVNVVSCVFKLTAFLTT